MQKTTIAAHSRCRCISGEEQALKALADLAHVVEPDVCVLVIGELEGLEFYREITRGLGAADYLPKPLARDLVARHFGAFILGRAPTASTAHGRARARGHRGARRFRRQFDRRQPGLAFRRHPAPPHRAGRSGPVSWECGVSC